MQIRIRETGDVVFSDEFRRIHSNTSFPADLTPDVLNELGADPVFEGPQPTLTENQYAKYDGVVQDANGNWMTSYVAVDYTAEELAAKVEQWRQSVSCTPFQGRVALSDAGLLASVEAAIAQADEKTKVAWEYALEWKRMSPMIATLGAALNLTDAEIDDLFKAAAEISA
jgi:hypothetical protein